MTSSTIPECRPNDIGLPVAETKRPRVSRMDGMQQVFAVSRS